MKQELKKIAGVLHERLNAIKTRGYTEERLDAAIEALDALERKLDGEDPIAAMGLDIGELVDNGSADGD